MNRTLITKPKLIIFDLDGVLIDSEIVWHRVNASEMTRLGFPLTVEKSIELFSGIMPGEYNNIMLKEYGKTISTEAATAININAETLYHQALKPIANIFGVLDYLEAKHINKCIASNGDHEYILHTLSITNLNKYFKLDQIFSSTMVKKGKPAPDVFLHAAAYFKINPEDCLVIEDHILGIKAAKTANMPVIGFLGGSHAQNQSSRERILKAEPTIIINDAQELLTQLKTSLDVN